ncbi:peptidoglycan DD-metalloendopeptidase family protein [Neobacillus mesonae]|uniref:Peptidase M23 n=1 Tax=Neobacillus mesonae TaxID=1193713 RepID=A0A3Q9R0K2_9BACI|nr:peptidoglycan DD-metalloendopeptidase family protein [Neobacillus mesonae]AZU63188.1 peptidase M23 [Neobacillus mesonae]MED4204253.1 peptidoglycan DD-metalloendopeptidase family protein [Neobacillus mesonae]
MRDYIRRFLIAIIMALCVSLLFLGGKHSQAADLPDSTGHTHWIWPADGVVSDTFGTRMGKHKGIDIAGKMDTPILSVEDGIVEKSYFSDTYGHVIFIKHPKNYVTVYAHLNKRFVKEGQKINQGQVIGKMGQTGQATGTHLHFESHQMEWRYDKKYAIDPEKLLGNTEVGEFVRGGVASNGVIMVSSPVRERAENNAVKQVKASKYIVQSGDTLYSIAIKKNSTVARIKEINGLTSDLIKPNQVLIMK